MGRLLLPVFLLASLAAAPRPQAGQVGLRMILVDTETEAADILARYRDGLFFGALARQHSVDPSAANGGYLGPVAIGELIPAFRDVLAGLSPGEVSPVTQIGEQFALFQSLTEQEERWIASNNAGLAAFAREEYAEAERSFVDAVREAEAPGGHGYMLSSSLHNLAVVYTRQERYADAEPLYVRSLEIQERDPGEERPDVAAGIADLAANYELQGNNDQAEALYRRALMVAEQSFGAEHPRVAAVLHQLGGLYEVLERYPEAESHYRRSLDILERTLPPEDPDREAVATSLNKFPSFPDFTCDPGMAFCNRALEAGLLAVMRYGRGAAWVDIDGDGWDDLFLADSDNRWDPDAYGVSMFFLNLRDGTFRPVPATELGIEDGDLVSTWNGSFADYDNDGDPDLLLANGGYSGVSNLALYENRMREGEGFVSVTASSGMATANASPARWWGTSWADYDGDGWLDVVVTRTEGPALLFHNEADGTFDEVGSVLGVGIPMQDGKNPVWFDYDADGDPDLYVAGMWEHAFYRNDAGDFTDVTGEVFPEPFPYPEDWAYAQGPIAFAAAAEDFNQDGFDDLYIGRWNVQDVLLLNDGRGNFRQHTTDWGLVTSFAAADDATLPFENTMGLGVGDLFDDGLPDVLIGTGDPTRAAADVVFCNTRDDSFYRCTDQILAGATDTWRTRSHGTVFSDFDHDGDTDMAVNLGGHADFDAAEGRVSPEWPSLFVNQTGPSGNTAALTLEGTRSNRDAIGARIRVWGPQDVDDGEEPRYYVVRSMQAFQSQNSRTQVLGLGSRTSAQVEIRWPSGTVQSLGIGAGDRLVITEP